MAKERPNLSCRIDPQIKEAFQEELYYNGVAMTEAIEGFMVNYVNISKNARERRNQQSG